MRHSFSLIYACVLRGFYFASAQVDLASSAIISFDALHHNMMKEVDLENVKSDGSVQV